MAVLKEERMPDPKSLFPKGRNYRGTLFLILLGFLIYLSIPSFTQSKLKASRGPVNPEFLKYLEIKASGKMGQVTADGHYLGHVPSPHAASSIRPERRGLGQLPPASYDLRTLNRVTSVKNQGGCGSCWAFATYGSLESILLPAETADYSEYDLIHNFGMAWDECGGGNIDIATAYLGRWAGPVNESDSPYPYAFEPVHGAGTVQEHVQGAIYFPRRSSSTDNTILKEAVMNYGALYIGMRWSFGAVNGTYHSYYNDGSYSIDGGHAICLVGWDDNYPASHFNKTAPGNGAFIVKNSWGTGWGENGYFYVSYYDNHFAKDEYSAAVLSEPTSNYSSVYQYDPYGWIDSWGYGSATAWGANIFAAVSSQDLAGVSFYAASGNFSYELYIYTGVTDKKPRTGSLGYSTSGAFPYAGYYTIKLPAAISLTAGQKFSVVVKFNTPGVSYPIPAEDYYAGYCQKVTSSPGQSFIDSAGAVGAEWEDVSANPTYKTNVCIKAFTGTAAAPPTIELTSPSAGDVWYRGETKSIAWTKTGAQTANVNIRLVRGANITAPIATGTPNDGSFDWKIPASTATQSDYFVRIKTTDGQTTGTSDPFSILPPSLTVTSPTAQTPWNKGAAVTVNWTKGGPQNATVRIQLWRNSSKVKDISVKTDNDGSYDWVVPSGMAAGSKYFVRVKTVDGRVKDDSDKFTIK